MNHHTIGALLIPLCLSCSAATVSLRPGLPALDTPGVPALWQSVADADRGESHMSLEPAAPYRWVFSRGDAIELRGQIGAEAPGTRAMLTVWDWERNPVAQQALAVPCRETIDLEVVGRGTYLLTMDLFSDERCVLRLVRSFGVCPDNRRRREAWLDDLFFVGTCAFPGRQHWSNDFGPAHPPGLSEQESRDLDAEFSARLGLQVVRPDLPVQWAGEDAEMDFSRADASMEAWTSRGFTLGLQVGQPGDWATKEAYTEVTDPKWRYPKREAPTRRYLAECIRRYGPHARFIEAYNETDNLDFWRGTPQEYIDFARWVAEEAAAAAPRVPVANAGYTLILPEWTGLLARELRPLTSMVAYHSHGDVSALDAMRRAMVAVHAAAGYADPVFVNTEMGYAAWRLDVERSQAATAIQKTLHCWARGDRGVLLYCSRDIGGPRLRQGDADWGYLDYYMCPRFMYGAVAAFIDQYAGARFETILSETHPLRAYLFSRGTERLVAVFTTPDITQKVAIESDAESASVLDPMGNATPAADPTRVEVLAGHYPQTIVLQGATEVRLGAGG